MATLRQTTDGVLIKVRVIPRARKTEIAGTRGTSLLVRLAAPPVDGAANEALVRFLATRLVVPRTHVTVSSGQRSRDKTIAVSGLSVETVRARLDVSGSGEADGSSGCA